ncbi:hypothetical protein GOQ27_08300 [Clostridium sp. D2Q-11]|uniref:Uncharacterized protein n=1 Tax=Anaeromonas frigoriresistens TaxID=2683708 RepID=A0A942Z8N8_9FIRM|nr:hypothetical protein [Anaeromonas frigoriresistens]MBS4538463.1 hypothetical protein [Anaeromonas frigoriresistens]
MKKKMIIVLIMLIPSIYVLLRFSLSTFCKFSGIVAILTSIYVQFSDDYSKEHKNSSLSLIFLGMLMFLIS